MSRGFAVSPGGSYAGWYGQEHDFADKGFPPGVSFVPDDDADARVAALRAERDLPPAQIPSFADDVITLLVDDAAPAQAKADAKARLLSRG